MNLRPGFVAFVYKLRRDEEQLFDVLKDKLSERQAGASTNTAKPVPIQLIYRVLNLL